MVARKSTSVMRGAHPLVGRALAYIEAHRSHPLSVEDVARGVGASRRLLEMRFRESLNRSPRREIQAHRMAQAAQLLKQTRLPVADVAAHCGYLELSHFYACFAREYGRPPAAWRREQLAGPSAAPLLKKRR
jgi:transcriptional regulator GlxA family with amidase domain